MIDLEAFSQHLSSGGDHTPPEMRVLLYALALSYRAEDILETGANVVAIDNLSEYGHVDKHARELLAKYDNCQLLKTDALAYLRGCPDESFDLIFIDDSRTYDHVEQETTETRRVIRPGGLIIFHDTIFCDLWRVVDTIFPDWGRMQLPAISPARDVDFGLGLVTRPPNVD
jgi:SAM-dependent methyltransferase